MLGHFLRHPLRAFYTLRRARRMQKARRMITWIAQNEPQLLGIWIEQRGPWPRKLRRAA